LIKGLKEFQEHLGGVLTIMLLAQLGEGIEVHEMDDSLIFQSVEMLKSFNQAENLIPT
jgi:3-dehydroquinate synthase